MTGPGFEVRVLGPFEVAAGGHAITIGSPKQRLLMAMLAIHGYCSVDQLAEELWDGRPPASLAPTLQSLMSRLRRIVVVASTETDPPVVLQARGDGYAADFAAGVLDSSRFEQLVDSGRRCLSDGELERSATDFRAGLALWRGPALAGISDREFARAEVARLERLRLDATEDLAEVELEAGRPVLALELLEKQLLDHPLRERAWGQKMVALYRLGRQADALRAYQAVRHVLADELGLAPTPALAQLEGMILRHDPQLDDPAAVLGRPSSVPEGTHRGLSPQHRTTERNSKPADQGRNLPTNVTSFVGRENELADLERRLTDTRLLTVTGVGGVGKTRLAIEAARRVVHRFSDGVWLVDLAPVRAPALVADAINASLGLLAGDRSAIEVLCSHLADRNTLLVLDNCEHLLDAVRDVVGALRAHCPHIVVIATSREVLGAAGETLWPAPGLSLPPAEPTGVDDLSVSDAVALFVERASTSQPGFALSDANAAAVSRICHRLDGLPLALELAAARLRVLGTSQLADRLDDRFKTLGSYPAEVDPRRRTLRAAMEWSWALLSTAERAALARLSVFPASFDLDSAEAVIAAHSGDALELIARLVDTSLLVVEPGERTGADLRYRLLETVRQFAAEQLEVQGAVSETEDRHLKYFFSRCDGWRAARRYWDETEWLLSAYRDREDFAVGLDRAVATGDLATAAAIVGAQWGAWTIMGRMASLRECIERAMSPPAAVPVEVAVDSLLGLAVARWETGRRGVEGIPVPLGEILREAGADLAVALRNAEAEGDPWVVGRVVLFLGQVNHWAGETAAAAALLHRARELFLAAGHRGALHVAGFCNYELGWAAMTMGDVVDADMFFASALTDDLGGADAVRRAHALAGAALAAAVRGDEARAARSADEAVLIASTLPFPGLRAMAFCRAAEAAALSGDVIGEAVPALLRTLRELGGVRWVAPGLALAALAAEAHGYREEAAAALASAGCLGEQTASTPALARLFDSCAERLAAELGADLLAVINARAIARPPLRALSEAAALLHPG